MSQESRAFLQLWWRLQGVSQESKLRLVEDCPHASHFGGGYSILVMEWIKWKYEKGLKDEYAPKLLQRRRCKEVSHNFQLLTYTGSSSGWAKNRYLGNAPRKNSLQQVATRFSSQSEAHWWCHCSPNSNKRENTRMCNGHIFYATVARKKKGKLFCHPFAIKKVL